MTKSRTNSTNSKSRMKEMPRNNERAPPRALRKSAPKTCVEKISLERRVNYCQPTDSYVWVSSIDLISLLSKKTFNLRRLLAICVAWVSVMRSSWTASEMNVWAASNYKILCEINSSDLYTDLVLFCRPLRRADINFVIFFLACWTAVTEKVKRFHQIENFKHTDAI